MNYREKYLKYKTKYLQLKHQEAGVGPVIPFGDIISFECIDINKPQNYRIKFLGDSALYSLYTLCNQRKITDYTTNSLIKFKENQLGVKTTFVKIIIDYNTEIDQEIRDFYNIDYIKTNSGVVINLIRNILSHFKLNTTGLPMTIEKLFSDVGIPSTVDIRYPTISTDEIVSKLDSISTASSVPRLVYKRCGNKMGHKDSTVGDIEELFALINNDDFKFIHRNYLYLHKKFSGQTLDFWLDKAFDCTEIFGRNIVDIIKSIDGSTPDDNIIDTADYKVYRYKLFKVIKYGTRIDTIPNYNLVSYLNATYGIASHNSSKHDDYSQFSQGAMHIMDWNALTLNHLIGFLYGDYNDLTFLSVMGHEFGHDFGAIGGGPLKFGSPTKIDELKRLFKFRTGLSDPNIGCKANLDWFFNEQVFNEFLADWFGVLLIEKYFRDNDHLDPSILANKLKNSFSWACQPGINNIQGGHPQNSIRMNTLLLNRYLLEFYRKYNVFF